jgi:hypothetical protein
MLLAGVVCVAMAGSAVSGTEGRAGPASDGQQAVARFARLALDCVHREYPNSLFHWLNDASDIGSPKVLHPAFYGCLDWHSSVHAHWMLARLARLHPQAAYARDAIEVLDEDLTSEKLHAELEYLSAPGRVSFERPYGLAWLLQLSTELRDWKDPRARRWRAAIRPLEKLAADRFREWLPKLPAPIRTGEHSQTAFAFGLVLDWARTAGDKDLARLIASRSEDYYLRDRDCPLAYEPDGQAFLSPCLAEADLMRRILEPERFASWLHGFLPQVPDNGDGGWLKPVVSPDPGDPKLAHLDGLNLSRAWMLEGIAAGLPADDKRRAALQASADAHRKAGVAAISDEHYEGSHWLGTFAVYLLTGRGL